MIILDPLSHEADPRLYVPLETGEHALAEISSALKDGRSPVLLSGPAGVGKSVLLMVLAERERNTYSRVRFARFVPPQPEEIAGWLLRLVFGRISVAGTEADDALLQLLRTTNDQPILLLVDELQHASDASVRKLIELSDVNPGALTLVAAGTHGPELSARSATLEPEVVVPIPDALPRPELEALYDAILAHPGLSPRLHARMASVARAEILDIADGSPRLLKDELLRRDHQRQPRVLVPPEETRPKADLVPPVRTLAASPQTALPHAASLRAASPPVKPVRAVAPPRARPPVVRAAMHRLADGLAQPFVAVGRGIRRALATFARACAFAIALPAELGRGALRIAAAGVRRTVDFFAALFAAATRGLRSVGRTIARPFVAAARALTSAVRHARTLAARAPWAIRSAALRVTTPISTAVRHAGEALIDSVRRARSYVREIPRRIGSAARARVSRMGTALASTAHDIAATSRAWSTRVTDRGARSFRLASSATAALDRRVVSAAQRTRSQLANARHESVLAIARGGRSAGRTLKAAALPAAVVVVVAALLTASSERPVRETTPPVSAAPAHAVQPVEIGRPAVPLVSLQVNARPWARVRIDGVDLGATPLSRSVAPGSYQLEAEFPDGRKIRRRIDVGPERRFVSLP